MNVSDRGLKLIADFEGFAPYLYNDPVGHATVGYGILVHTGNYHEQRGVCAACDRWPRRREPRDTWLTQAQGRALLVEKVRPYADAVLRTTRPLRQPEFDALTSLCYNIGPGGYLNSNVRAAVNAHQDPCPALRQIVRGTDGVVYPGLVRRREAECVLFHSEEEHMPTPEYDALFQRDEEIKTVLARVDAGVKFLITVIGPLAQQVYGDDDPRTKDLKQRVDALERDQ